MNSKNKNKKSASQYQKLRINKHNFIKNMDNLHFLPNYILIRFFKELTKYKKDYISIIFKSYKVELYYVS